MKALIDTGVWFRRYHRLPLKSSLMQFFEGVREWHLSPLSVAEIAYKWRRGRLRMIENPKLWIEDAIAGYHLEGLTPEICRQAGAWDWDHGDLVDRLLAATAKATGLTLVHTDTRLKNFTGFPHKYFANAPL
jgi:PIN domain nuclease of toxin-antitoxin system